MIGCVVWLTGLPSSGKSYFAQRIRDELLQRSIACCLLDGDRVRAILKPSPGYSRPERDTFYATLAGLAAELAGQGLVVLVPATADRRAYRDRARALAPRFIEVLLDVSPELSRARDAKGLYARAAAGATCDLPGADLEYERPSAADVTAMSGDDDDALARILAKIGA